MPAGFSIKKKHFFDNFGAVTTLGVIGTVVTTAVLGLQAFAVLRFIGLEKQPVSSSLALGTIFSSSVSMWLLNNPHMTPQHLNENCLVQMHDKATRNIIEGN